MMSSSIASPSPNNRQTQRRSLRTNHPNSQSDTDKLSQPTTPPRTPRRTEGFQHVSHTRNVSSADESGSKRKQRNRNQKNGVNTPPANGAQSSNKAIQGKAMFTPSTAAFAGATFHASPAPSALPIPSFYSKSVPDSPLGVGLKTNGESSPDNSDPSNSPPRPAIQREVEGEESPLDFFFRADREEKARVRSASSTHGMTRPQNPFVPPPGSAPDPRPSAGSSSPSGTRKGHHPRNSAGGMFAMELDGPGNNEAPFGPAFSTPYAERINAARLSGGTTQRPPPPQNHQLPVDNAEALKAYLFAGLPPPPSTTLHPSYSAPSLTPTSSPHHSVAPPYGEHRGGMVYPSLHNATAAGAHDNRTPNRFINTSTRQSGLRKELDITPTKSPGIIQNQTPSHLDSPTPTRTHTDYASNFNNFAPNSYSHPSSPPPIPSNNSAVRSSNAELKGMEESLRRLLKLDSTGN